MEGKPGNSKKALEIELARLKDELKVRSVEIAWSKEVVTTKWAENDQLRKATESLACEINRLSELEEARVQQLEQAREVISALSDQLEQKEYVVKTRGDAAREQSFKLSDYEECLNGVAAEFRKWRPDDISQEPGDGLNFSNCPSCNAVVESLRYWVERIEARLEQNTTESSSAGPSGTSKSNTFGHALRKSSQSPFSKGSSLPGRVGGRSGSATLAILSDDDFDSSGDEEAHTVPKNRRQRPSRFLQCFRPSLTQYQKTPEAPISPPMSASRTRSLKPRLSASPIDSKRSILMTDQHQHSELQAATNTCPNVIASTEPEQSSMKRSQSQDTDVFYRSSPPDQSFRASFCPSSSNSLDGLCSDAQETSVNATSPARTVTVYLDQEPSLFPLDEFLSYENSPEPSFHASSPPPTGPHLVTASLPQGRASIGTGSSNSGSPTTTTMRSDHPDFRCSSPDAYMIVPLPSQSIEAPLHDAPDALNRAPFHRTSKLSKSPGYDERWREFSEGPVFAEESSSPLIRSDGIQQSSCGLSPQTQSHLQSSQVRMLLDKVQVSPPRQKRFKASLHRESKRGCHRIDCREDHGSASCAPTTEDYIVEEDDELMLVAMADDSNDEDYRPPRSRKRKKMVEPNDSGLPAATA